MVGNNKELFIISKIRNYNLFSPGLNSGSDLELDSGSIDD